MFTKKKILIGSLLLLLVFISCKNHRKNNISKKDYNTIVQNFRTPSAKNTVWTYYYWINDNVSKEGITKDLEAMKKAGIGTALIGNINLKGEDGNMPILSENWWDAMVHAVTEAHRLGIDIGVFNCPGWSQSGGPWIKPEMAARYITYSETVVQGGQLIHKQLEKPKDTFQPVKTIAFKLLKSEERDLRHLQKNIFTDLENVDVTAICDNNNTTGVQIDVNNTNKASFEFELKEPIVARQFTIKPGSIIKCNGSLYAIKNGKETLLKDFYFDRSLLYINGGPNVGFDAYGELAIALPETKADKFKLVLKDLNPITGWGNSDSKMTISEINISEAPVLDHFVEKQLGKMFTGNLPAWDYYSWKSQDKLNDTSLAIPEVIDITEFVNDKGVLNWNAPLGEWTIQYFGMTPTGSANLPAAPRGKGLEVDKINKKHLKTHFESFIGTLLSRIPEESKPAFKYVVIDSYETGSLNWTDAYEIKFKKKYGYDPIHFLPVLSGRIVRSIEESNRFLWDLRRSIADDIAYEYIGEFRKLSNKNGLKLWMENYGHWGFPAEFMMYGGQSDLVGGEFWEGKTAGNTECRAAASTAHTYGKPFVSAEAYTAVGSPYQRYPSKIKKSGDWAFSQGINHFVFHVYIHQPYEEKNPGIDAWFGTEFNRKNTWYSQLNYYTDYIRRNQQLLQLGNYVADVCYFIGENTPIMTGPLDPKIPEGYSYDFINAEVIINRLSVKNGRLTLPEGLSYKVMVLPKLNSMRPKTLSKIEELVKQGAIILGHKPQKSPSLENYPQNDILVKELASKLWHTEYKNNKLKNIYGKGLVYDGYDLETILSENHTSKDIILNNKNILWTHRKVGDVQIYYLANQSDDILTVYPSFRIQGLKPQLWDAISGEIRHLNNYTEKDGRITVPLKFEAQRSWLLVFTNKDDVAIENGYKVNFPKYRTLYNLKGPYNINFLNKDMGPKEVTTIDQLQDLALSSDDKVKYYSGTIIYSTNFTVNDLLPNKELYVNLGNVAVMAEISINGKKVGGVWDAPYRIKITDFVKLGKNKLQIKVVNLWQNRLLKDQMEPENKHVTWTSENHDFKDQQPHESGLIGPVNIEIIDK